MARDGTQTRTAIMDVAEELILERGFAGTPVDDMINAAGVTKGAFFHHFPTKQALAYALIDRYSRADLQHLESKMARAESLHDDPLEQLLLFVALFREQAAELAGPTPGCLFGSYCYEAGMFDETINSKISDNMLTWRERLVAKFEEVAALYPPRREVDFESLADLMTGVVEGAFIMSRTLKTPDAMADGFEHYRRYLELLFRS